MTFHDGSPFNADAVVWNVNKVLDKSARQFDPSQSASPFAHADAARGRKIDDLTVELTTSEPDSFPPYNLTNLFIASPAQWEKKFAAVPASVTEPVERAKQAWVAFAADASGTGPFRMTRFVPRERLELARNAHYWDGKRLPKIDKVVMLPMPEANARTAALLSGQSTGSRRRPLTPSPRSRAAASRSTPTSSRMCGRGSCPSRRSPRSTSACAVPPTCA